MLKTQMNMTKQMIDHLTLKVIDLGCGISEEEARQLIMIDNEAEIDSLLSAAHKITLQFHSRRPECCSLINAKSYLCGEDCAFCAQSVHYKTDIKRYLLIDSEEIVKSAKRFEAAGVKDFCVVTSGMKLNAEEFGQILETYKRLRAETRLNLDGSLGHLTVEQVRQLKAVGVRRINDNLQCSRQFYPQIVTTHTYDDRLQSLKNLQDGGIEICSGLILGMGESREDRIKLMFELRPYHPRCIPINILNPRPGTPLENQPKLEAVEILKTIAVFRFVHPQANIKLAGGREWNLSPQDQERAVRGGANGLITGGYLTTRGNPIENDMQMMKRAGYEVEIQTVPETTVQSS